MKLIKKRKIKKNLNLDSSHSKSKIKKKLKNDIEYFSILEKLSLNNNNLFPIIQQTYSSRFNSFKNKRKYQENTFLTTGLYSNLNKLQEE